MANVALSEPKRSGAAWWLVLSEGILAIIVGILLWMYPVRAFITLSVFVGVFWLVSGIFDIVSIFFDRSQWGWKLFMGIVGIIAGGFLMSQVILGAVNLALVTVIFVGFMGIFYGMLGLVRAFQGAGWGAGIIGIIGIMFGIFILSNKWAAALAIPWVFGFLGILGGILAIFGAFVMRSEVKARKELADSASKSTPMRETRVSEVNAPSQAPVAAAEVLAAAKVVKDNSLVVEESQAEVAVVEGDILAATEPAEEAIMAEEVLAQSAESSEGEIMTMIEKAEIVESMNSERIELPNMADIPEEQANYLKKDIQYVEGIGPVYGSKLKEIGIASPLDLLSKGATRKGRELISKATGITITLVLKWVNRADLFRVKGVGSEYADLLEVAGVDTVVELAQRNAANLYQKLLETNEAKKLVRQLPSQTQVANWVEDAKKLGRIVRY